MKVTELTEQDVVGLAQQRGEPEWLRDRRQEAYKAYSDLAWPTRQTEEWRYTDPARFDLTRPLAGAGDPAARADRGIVAALGDDVAGSVRIIDNDVQEPRLSATAAAAGVVVSDLASAAVTHEALVREHLGAVVGADDKFTALSLAAHTPGLFVHVPADVVLDAPLAITVQVTQPGLLLPRILIVVDRHARANLYLDHVGDAETTVIETVEVVVGDSAEVALVSTQDWGDRVDHIGNHRLTVGSDAVARHLEATLGGRTVYLRPDCGLDHPGGRAELFGVYFGSGEQQIEHRTLIHHNASKTASESIYKGALQGRSSATWFGNIRIEPHAKATSSDETNRNLILTDGSHANSIPFLEIQCSDVVQCGHHSSVGQVDELQLFYLTSRGIPRSEAVRMLVFGFFAEVTDRIDLPGVTDTLLSEIEYEIRSGVLATTDPRRTRRAAAAAPTGPAQP
ncbi:MAG TPA: SufD family Fe-S cluster assembly protein [Euzebyales bacterium]|nr:SufD family Fe-S cluster assembly protein [Euzebyales bacterium]